MKQTLQRRLPARFVFALSVSTAASLAAAQTAPSAYESIAYDAASAESASAGADGVIASHVVRSDGAKWLRLVFAELRLAPGATLRIASLQDGAEQHLNAVTAREWRATSAYFNGPAVRVELLAPPGADGSRFRIGSLMAGREQPIEESQCGASDDRVASSLANRARLIDVGCTANLMADGCFTTAGHCLSDARLVDVVEFEVPKSRSNGALRHPPPSEQYVPTSTRSSVEGGIGNDWGVFTVFPNSETGLTPLEAQGPGLSFATAVPSSGQSVTIVGYGVDDGKANQTQQTNAGAIQQVQSGSTTLTYRVDTEGGNSGSAVIRSKKVVAIHTNGGCTTGGGANSGTLFTNAGLQSAMASVCSAARRLADER